MEVFTLEHIERNFQILEQKMINVMENALDFGNELIDTELDLGIFDLILKPLIKSFYAYWRNNDAKQGTLIQINTTLSCGKYLSLHGNGSNELFNETVEKNFPAYFNADQVSRQCKRNHKNFSRLKEIVRWAFISRLEESILMLKVKDDVQDYESLVQATFKTKEEAFNVLVKQLDRTDESIKIIEEDLSILKLPTAKNLLIKTLRKGFEKTRKDMIKNLDNIYK